MDPIHKRLLSWVQYFSKVNIILLKIFLQGFFSCRRKAVWYESHYTFCWGCRQPWSQLRFCNVVIRKSCCLNWVLLCPQNWRRRILRNVVAFEDKVACKSKGSFSHFLIAFGYDRKPSSFWGKEGWKWKQNFPTYSARSSYLKNQALVFFPFIVCHFQNGILSIGGENSAENTETVKSTQTRLFRL